MTNVEFALSYETVKFLDQWLMREFRYSDSGIDQKYADRLRDSMLHVLADDEPYWCGRSLWCAYDVALKHIDLS